MLACSQEKHGTSFEDFFDLLQQAAEEQGLMDSGDDDEFRDWVPLQAVEEFISNFNDGAQHFMAATFPEHYLKGVPGQESVQARAHPVALHYQKGKSALSP